MNEIFKETQLEGFADWHPAARKVAMAVNEVTNNPEFAVNLLDWLLKIARENLANEHEMLRSLSRALMREAEEKKATQERTRALLREVERRNAMEERK